MMIKTMLWLADLWRCEACGMHFTGEKCACIPTVIFQATAFGDPYQWGCPTWDVVERLLSEREAARLKEAEPLNYYHLRVSAAEVCERRNRESAGRWRRLMLGMSR